MNPLQFYSDSLTAVIHMAATGVPFDVRRLRALDSRLKARVARCEAAAARHFDLPLSGKGSQKRLEPIVLDAIKETRPDVRDHPSFQATPAGRPSSKRLQRMLLLAHLPKRHPLRGPLRLVHKFREARDARSRYTRKLLREDGRGPILDENGLVRIVYPSWHVSPSAQKDGGGSEGGTSQVRLAATGGKERLIPPIQTLPPAVKACIRSPYRRGWVVWADAPQIEYRVAGLVSGDPYIIDSCQPGRDAHTELAIEIEGPAIVNNPHFKSGDRKNDPRQIYKQVRFLQINRGGGKRLLETVLEEGGPLLPIERCYDLVRGMKQRQIVFWRWQDDLIAQVVRNQGVLRLPFVGAVRHFSLNRRESKAWGGESSLVDENEIVNMPIQAYAAAVMQQVQAVLTPLLPPQVRIPLNTHDSITAYGPPGTLRKYLHSLQDAVHYVRTRGLWRLFEEYYGHEVPFLDLDIKTVYT